MPFVNGQWQDGGDFDFTGKFRKGYDTGMERGARSDALDAYGAGDADRAASLIMPYDTQAASAYRDEGTRSYQKRYADAYGSGDFERAQTEARGRGDLQGLEAARTGQNNSRFRGMVSEANKYRSDLRRIQTMQDPKAKNEAYDQFLATAAEAAKAAGNDPRFLSELKQSFPEWNDQTFNALDQILLQTARAYSSDNPEGYIEQWSAEQKAKMEAARAARDDSKLDLDERRVAATEARTEAQIARLERAGNGNGAQWRPMTAEELSANNLPPGTSALMDDNTGNVKTLRSQRQYTEGSSAAASFAARMRAAIIELRRAEQDPNFKIQDTINPLTMNPAAQRWLGAARDLINAQLRRESGAAIGPNEFSSARNQYLPTPIDWSNRGAREAKYNRLNGMFRAMREQSQGAYDEWYGEPGTAENPIIGADGNPVANQLGQTPGAPPPHPPNVPPNFVWNPNALNGRGMFEPPPAGGR